MQFSLTALLLAVTALPWTSAVTVKLYDSMDCSGTVVWECKELRQGSCCAHPSGRVFYSAQFQGLGDTAIGAVCKREGKRACGRSENTGVGSSVCVKRRRAHPSGAMWFDCLNGGKNGASCPTAAKADDDGKKKNEQPTKKPGPSKVTKPKRKMPSNKGGSVLSKMVSKIKGSKAKRGLRRRV